MNFYVDSGGVVLHVDPERIFQGSANANTIRFVGAFASNLSVTTAFKLPNGVWTVPQKMTLSAQLPGIQMPDGTQFNTWEYKIPATVTENYGAVNVQFFVYGDTGGTGGQIASAMSSFEVEKGVPITLPDPTDDYNTLLTQILSTLSQLQGFYDGLNIDLEQLQTSVRGLQGEVSGIQIDLEQVHTDLGNRVEKTTLTYSLYGTDKNGNQAIIPYGTTGLGNSIPQYTADSEIRIPASPTQSYYAANKGYVDKGLQEKLDKTGGEIHGDLLVGGELRVLDDTIIIGNLTVQGTTITEDAETIMSKANVIVTNSEGAPLTQLSGIGIRTNATLVYGIMYDPGDDTVKLGEGTLDANNEFTFNSGEGTAVATRADSAMWTNGHLSMWNAAEYRFVDSGIAADNVVTVNTAQQITGAKTFAQAVRVGTGNVYASYYTGGVIWRDSMGNDHANIFPAGSGTLALTSDIPTDYVTQEEFEKAQRSIEDIYTILGQTVILWQSLTQEYTTRETAAGLDIIDGALTEVKEIRGKTVATENLIPFPYADTTKTVNGVTFTNNGDGTITVNGTATDNAIFNLKTITVQIGGNYFLSGCPSTGSTTTYIVYAADGVYGYADAGAGKLINPASTNLSLSVLVYAGATLSNVVFRPMLNAGTTALPYQPYFKGLKNAYFKEIVSTGKNLIDLSGVSLEKTVNGVTSTKISDGQYRVTGTIADPSQGVSSTVNINQGKVYPAGVYSTARYTVDGKDIEFFVSAYSAKTGAPIRNIDGANININEDFVIRSAGIYVNRAITGAIDLTVSTMLNFGSSALPYEPYISDTLSAENPIELAEYDVADTETGETKRQSNTLTFDGTEAWHLTAQSEGYFLMAIGINPHAAESSGDIISNYGENSTPAGAPNNDFGFYIANADKSALVIWFNNNFYPNVTDLSSAKSQLAAWAEAGDPLTVTYKTAEATTEVTPFNKSRYQAWDGGSETIYQGTNDNSEYGAENTVVQNYATKRGGTTE